MSLDQAVYRSVGRIVVRQIGGDRLLVPVSGVAAAENVVFPLNEAGVFIWEQLTDGKTLEEAALGLVGAFEVALETARSDCRSYVKRLMDQNLLEVASE